MMEEQINQTIDQLVFFQKYVSKIYERCLYSQLYDYFVKNIFQNTNVAFVKALVLRCPSSHDRKNENHP